MSLVLGSFEKARVYIMTHSRETGRDVKPGLSITLSRQTGAGADVIAKKLVDFFLPYQKEGELEWTVFDKNLIDKILEDHNLPERLAHFYSEKKQSLMQQFVNDLFYGHSSYEVIKKTAHTILQFVSRGNVIVVGMGGNIITSGRKEVVHVRVDAPLEKRIEHVMDVYNLSKTEAAKFTPEEDARRKQYIKGYYHKDVDDPLLYDMVVNTGECSYDEAVEAIGRLVLKRAARLNG